MINKSYKHWIIVLLCCGLAGASIGVSINCSGIFYSYVCNDLNFSRGDFAMHMTIYSLIAACTALFIPKIMSKVNLKILLIVSSIVAFISTYAMSYGTTLEMFYFLGAIRGISTSLFSIVPLTMIINQWFEQSHGLATSIVFGTSGLVGTILSPILTNYIELHGWQSGYQFKAIIALVLCLPAILYPFSFNPRKDGLLPYGYTERKETNFDISNKNFRFKNKSFICFFIFALSFSTITSISQHLPSYGLTLNYTANHAALLLSLAMIGNIVSKLSIGILSDYLGAFKATYIMIAINLIGMLLLLFNFNATLLLAGALLYGSCYSIAAVGLPLLTKRIFGIENYAKVFPKISFASSIGAAISLSLVGYIYDLFKSYNYAFYLAILLICISVVLINTARKQKSS